MGEVAGGNRHDHGQVLPGGLRLTKEKKRWAMEEDKFFQSTSVIVHNNYNNNEEQQLQQQQQPSCSSQSSIGSPSLDTSSSCFSDDYDDASSSSCSPTASNSSSSSTLVAKNDSPLYELSELMSQLPIKRGLSSFYEGKSQSYTSLGSVQSLEDLVKKVPSGRIMKMKSKCKSFCLGLERQKKHCYYGPKPGISKKGGGSSNRVSCFSSLAKTPSSSASASASVHQTTYLL